MSKEMLKQADDWLKSMYDLLSLKTDNEDREYTQNKIDLFEWLIKQAEHNLVLQERLAKRGRQISGLKNALQRNRGAREKAEWNELVQRGVSDLSVRSNRKNYELNKKLKEQNKRYREAREQISKRYDQEYHIQNNEYDGSVADGLMVAMNIIDKSLEGESDE